MTTQAHEILGIECLNQEAFGGDDSLIPTPRQQRHLLFFKRYHCNCGERFSTEKDYRRHFRVENEAEWFRAD